MWAPALVPGLHPGVRWVGQAGLEGSMSLLPWGHHFTKCIFFPVASPLATAAPPDVPGAALGPAALEVFLHGGKPWDTQGLCQAADGAEGAMAW